MKGAMDRFFMMCGHRNCTFRVNIEDGGAFTTHLKRHLVQCSKTVYLSCPRCKTRLYKLRCDKLDDVRFDLKRGWNHVAGLQPECAAAGTPINFVHFLIELEGLEETEKSEFEAHLLPLTLRFPPIERAPEHAPGRVQPRGGVGGGIGLGALGGGGGGGMSGADFCGVQVTIPICELPDENDSSAFAKSGVVTCFPSTAQGAGPFLFCEPCRHRSLLREVIGPRRVFPLCPESGLIVTGEGLGRCS
uniref:ORF20 n=1 Tax=Latid herpesvirus 1 TaxID=3096545 RepID=A0AB33V948_9VIRU